jgi:histidine triad (HIT) family protein
MGGPSIATCFFCDIARGDMEDALVYSDTDCIAFLDHRPLFPGHCLVVPRPHFETLGDLPAELVTPLFRAAQLLTRAVAEGMEADGTFVAINNKVSQSVPHVHVHVIPRRFKDGLRGFFWPRQKYASVDEMRAAQQAIAAAARRLAGARQS